MWILAKKQYNKKYIHNIFRNCIVSFKTIIIIEVIVRMYAVKITMQKVRVFSNLRSFVCNVSNSKYYTNVLISIFFSEESSSGKF